MRGGWIVDANNVVGSRPDGWWHDRPAALARLLDEISRWREATGDPVVLVADGFPTSRVPEGDHSGVLVRYAGSNERDAADDEIVRLVGAAPAPGALTVVTSDRGLRERVVALGAAVEGARTFRSRIADVDAPDRGP